MHRWTVVLFLTFLMVSATISAQIEADQEHSFIPPATAPDAGTRAVAGSSYQQTVPVRSFWWSEVAAGASAGRATQTTAT